MLLNYHIGCIVLGLLCVAVRVRFGYRQPGYHPTTGGGNIVCTYFTHFVCASSWLLITESGRVALRTLSSTGRGDKTGLKHIQLLLPHFLNYC